MSIAGSKRIRTLTLRDATADSGEAEVYRDRFVLTLRGNFEGGHGARQRVHVHIRWEILPWLMRKIWAAWWKHKTDMLANLQWVEQELGGSGVKRPESKG